MVRTFDAPLSGRGRRFAVLVARFNEPVTRRLLAGALAAFRAQGAAEEDVVVIWVPGAFELAGAAVLAVDALGVDAVVALGAVIRGETAHFEYVARAAADGILDASLHTRKPVIFGVLTVDDMAQAEARSGDGPGNKGFDAALCAMEMANLYAELLAAKEERP